MSPYVSANAKPSHAHSFHRNLLLITDDEERSENVKESYLMIIESLQPLFEIRKVWY